MKFMLDANAVIAIVKRNHRFGERLRRHGKAELAVSAIAMHELYFGVYRSDRVEQNLNALTAIDIAVVEFDEAAAARAGEIRADLMREGRIIGPYDTMIAGHALARDLTLVTHNIREFERVPGLRLEDWEA